MKRGYFRAGYEDTSKLVLKKPDKQVETGKITNSHLEKGDFLTGFKRFQTKLERIKWSNAW